jgi:hypothetical protein
MEWYKHFSENLINLNVVNKLIVRKKLPNHTQQERELEYPEFWSTENLSTKQTKLIQTKTNPSTVTYIYFMIYSKKISSCR